MHRMLALAAALLCACQPAPGAEAPAPDTLAPVVVHPSALRRVADPWVERTLGELSLREKVGQMMLAWTGGNYAPGSEDLRRLETAVRRDGVGGIIISIGSPQAYVAKLNAMQNAARVPLLMVTDMESGPGMRLTGSATDIPPAMGLAATGSDSLAFEVGRVIAKEARAVGIHLTLSPVLDVNSNPQNPIINTRSYGEDPEQVGRFAAAYVRGLHAGGVLAAGKHFPGHGDTRVDSHIDLPSIAADRARLDSVELPPFRMAVRAGIDAMLVGHIAVPRVTGDDRLASLSTKLTGDLLRREMGFGGLVFTDAMNMGALTRRYGEGEAAVLAIEAGADLLLQPVDIPRTIDAVVAAVRSGRLTEARIDQSVRRLLEAKSRVKLNEQKLVDGAALGRSVGTDEHRRVAEAVATRSITLARDSRNLVPLASGARRILSITYADAGRSGAGAFNAALQGGGRTVEQVRVGASTTAAELERVRQRAAAADVVVVSALVTPREYQGTVETSARFAEMVERLARDGRPVIAVSFGSPYLIRSFPSVSAYLLAWGPDVVSQQAAARALLGQAPITGRLPVTLPGSPRGTGVVRGQGAGR